MLQTGPFLFMLDDGTESKQLKFIEKGYYGNAIDSQYILVH